MQPLLLSVIPLLRDPEESGIDLTRYVLVCLLTIGLVLVFAWLLRRFVAQGLRKRAGMRSLAVMDVLPLGRRQRAVVLRCYDRAFLIGLGEREVSLLAELDPEAQEELEPSPPARNTTRAVREPAPEPVQESASEEEVENFAETLAAELPMRKRELQPGARIPKGGLLG